MTFPVNPDLKASIADNAVSESPITMQVLGSTVALWINFFLEKAGTCSGIMTQISSSLTWVRKDEIFLRDGPQSTKPFSILQFEPHVGHMSLSPRNAPVARFVQSNPQKEPTAKYLLLCLATINLSVRWNIFSLKGSDTDIQIIYPFLSKSSEPIFITLYS